MWISDNLFNPPEVAEWRHVPENEFSRYTINLATGDVSKSIFLNKVNSVFVNMFDFPIINEQYRGKAYCFAYGISMINYSRTAIVKKDVCGTSTDRVWYKENHYLSEIWFYPTPDAHSEDDGVIMTIAYDGEKRLSYLMFLDGVTLETIGISYLPVNVPWSAHGMHFPEAQYDF